MRKAPKYEEIEIVYSAKKFSTLRVKALKNATPKQMGKAIATLMSKGYKIVETRVNGMELHEYCEYYKEASLT